MAPFGAQHLVMLALVVLACAIGAGLARRAERTPQGRGRRDRILRAAGWVLLANAGLWTLWGFMPWAWDIDESLPLHFSDALRFVGPLALITRERHLVAITYFWGLTLNTQSLLTPDLNYAVWPWLEFVEYWLAHGVGAVIPVVLVWGLGMHPTWRTFAAAYAATLLWALLAMLANALTGANYSYLAHAPQGPSLLDVLGPWPAYILVEAVLVAVVWALITLPWVLLDHRAPAAARAADTVPG